MAGLQKKPSTGWAISSGATLGGGKGKVGAGIVGLTLFDVQSQLYIPLGLVGGGVGGGIPVGVTCFYLFPGILHYLEATLGRRL